jgi:hypothetical protein
MPGNRPPGGLSSIGRSLSLGAPTNFSRRLIAFDQWPSLSQCGHSGELGQYGAGNHHCAPGGEERNPAEHDGQHANPTPHATSLTPIPSAIPLAIHQETRCKRPATRPRSIERMTRPVPARPIQISCTMRPDLLRHQSPLCWDQVDKFGRRLTVDLRPGAVPQ